MDSLELIRRIDKIERELEMLRTIDRPSGVGAKYRTNAGQSIPNATATIINFEDQDYDTHSAVTTGAAWKFTAPIPGYYLVNAMILFTQVTTWAETEIVQLHIYVDGADTTHLDRNWGQDSSGAAEFKRAGGIDVVYLTSGGYLDIRVNQQSGAALALQTSGLNNYVGITRVG